MDKLSIDLKYFKHKAKHMNPRIRITLLTNKNFWFLKLNFLKIRFQIKVIESNEKNLNKFELNSA